MKLGSSIKRIVRIEPEHYRVTVEFSDGVRGAVDLGFLFEKPGRRPLILEIIRGQMFGKCFVESGALAWPNGYELCPDAIRGWMHTAKAKKNPRAA